MFALCIYISSQLLTHTVLLLLFGTLLKKTPNPSKIYFVAGLLFPAFTFYGIQVDLFFLSDHQYHQQNLELLHFISLVVSPCFLALACISCMKLKPVSPAWAIVCAVADTCFMAIWLGFYISEPDQLYLIGLYPLYMVSMLMIIYALVKLQKFPSAKWVFLACLFTLLKESAEFRRKMVTLIPLKSVDDYEVYSFCNTVSLLAFTRAGMLCPEEHVKHWNERHLPKNKVVDKTT